MEIKSIQGYSQARLSANFKAGNDVPPPPINNEHYRNDKKGIRKGGKIDGAYEFINNYENFNPERPLTFSEKMKIKSTLTSASKALKSMTKRDGRDAVRINVMDDLYTILLMKEITQNLINEGMIGESSLNGLKKLPKMHDKVNHHLNGLFDSMVEHDRPSDGKEGKLNLNQMRVLGNYLKTSDDPMQRINAKVFVDAAKNPTKFF